MIEREVDLGEPCSIEDMKERLSVVYERLNERGSHEDEDDDKPNDGDDKAFYANGKAFKGKCNNCGAYGHKLSECRKRTEVTTIAVAAEDPTEELTLATALKEHATGVVSRATRNTSAGRRRPVSLGRIPAVIELTLRLTTTWLS